MLDQAEYRRMMKVLFYGPATQFMLAQVSEECVGEALAQVETDLVGAALSFTRIALSSTAWPNLPRFVDELERLASEGVQVIHVIPEVGWVTQRNMEILNILRERLVSKRTCRVVFWMTSEDITCMAMHAIDLWSWRHGPFRLFDTKEAL
jgi:hypothetical protein